MSSILLSFCIPTYNRPERISRIINQIIPFQSEEIEIVIGDDNPSFEKTQEVVKNFTDPRINYFRNRKNLGLELNIIKIFKRANGEFLFLIMDEDDVEMKAIPWILKTIKQNLNLTHLYGSLGDKRPGQKENYKELGDRYLKQGAESLKEFLFYTSHASGWVLKKKY